MHFQRAKSKVYRIEKLGISPIIDKQWIQHFPEHQNNLKETLVHHQRMLVQGEFGILNEVSKVYSLEELREKLYEQCVALDFEVPELELKQSLISSDELLELEDKLGITMSQNTKELIKKYDFGEFSVGGVFFGQTGDYLTFLRRFNCEEDIGNWWGEGERPKEKLLIAGTDGYIIWQDINSEKIYAYLRTTSPSESICISENFELLIRGAGTVHFNRQRTKNKESLAKKIAEECHAPEGYKFWNELVLGFS